ncbi:MAG: YicC family protein [Candidatus Symbiothrix sp.]|jgi:uncharacterized protein (TIGR00255 family)|nr:YicC family protein [Candidatus Symbiothrix sp.]
MLQSMTGFGKSTTEIPNKKIVVEIKSLNGKQLDINSKIPTAYREKEVEMRTMLSQTIERGKVDFLVSVEQSDASGASKINPYVIQAYYNQIRETVQQMDITFPENWLSVVLRLPEAVRTEIVDLDEYEWKLLHRTVKEALNHLVAFRTQEGKMIEEVLQTKIEAIAELLSQIDQYDAERTVKIKQRMEESLRKLEVVSYDENRFEQEMIYYIERLDISEEKARLDNHLKYFLTTMHTEHSQGRKLGFIAQEMGREINTLGSKSNHAEMQKLVVRMKDELEQIKEQVLNIL